VESPLSAAEVCLLFVFLLLSVDLFVRHPSIRVSDFDSVNSLDHGRSPIDQLRFLDAFNSVDCHPLLRFLPDMFPAAFDFTRTRQAHAEEDIVKPILALCDKGEARNFMQHLVRKAANKKETEKGEEQGGKEKITLWWQLSFLVFALCSVTSSERPLCPISCCDCCFLPFDGFGSCYCIAGRHPMSAQTHAKGQHFVVYNQQQFAARTAEARRARRKLGGRQARTATRASFKRVFRPSRSTLHLTLDRLNCVRMFFGTEISPRDIASSNDHITVVHLAA
jgi:hypothetical protein